MSNQWANAEVELTVNAARLEADIQRKLEVAARRASANVQLMPGGVRTATAQPFATGPSSMLGPTALQQAFAATAPPAQAKGLAAMTQQFQGVATAANLARASVAAYAGVKIGGAIVGELGKTIDAFSSFQEQATSVRVQFGTAADAIFDFAETAAQTAGISERAALQASLTFGAFFEQLKLAPAVTAQLSRGLVQLSGDFASFRDVATDEAIRIITAGLAGESEPLRRRGVLVDEQTVKQKAFTLKLGETSRELTQQEKVVSRAAVLFDRLTKAQTDFIRTGDNLANMERQLSANLENFRKNVGELATPAVAGATGALNDLALSAEHLAGQLPHAEQATRSLGAGVTRLILGTLSGGATEALRLYGRLFGGITSEQELAIQVNEEYEATQVALNQAINQARGNIDQYRNALSALNVGLITSVEDIDKYLDAQLKFVDQQSAVVSAQLRVESAQLRVRDAQRDYERALAGNTEAAEKETDALEQLRRAGERVLDVRNRIIKLTDDVGEAEAKLADARSVFGVQSKEADDASDELRDKNEDLRQANENLRQATVDAAEADEDYTETVKEAKDGSDSLAEASLALRSAQQQLKDALTDSAVRAAEFEIAQRTANGETLDGIQKAEIYRTKLNEIAGTLAPDSPLRLHLQQTADLFKNLFPSIAVPPEIQALLEMDFSSGAALGTTRSRATSPSGSVAPGGSTPPAPGVIGGSETIAPPPGVGAGGVTINQFSPTDPVHTSAEIAWQTGL